VILVFLNNIFFEEIPMTIFDDTLKTVQGVHADAPEQFALTVAQPDALLPCIEELGSGFPLKQFSATSKRELFRTYSECQGILAEMYGQAAHLLSQILVCNTELVNVQKARAMNATAIRDELYSHQTNDERLEFSAGSTASAEIAAKSTPDIAELLVTSVRDQALSLLNGLNRQLAYLVAIEQVGSITWMKDDVCRYTFFENKVTDRKTGGRKSSEVVGNQRRTTTKESFDREFEHTRVVHDVIDAQKHPLPAFHVDQPQRVELLIDAVPSWLDGISAVVTGFEISEERSTRRGVVDQWTDSNTTVEDLPVRRVERARYDPAVIIGPYVLTGWN